MKNVKILKIFGFLFLFFIACFLFETQLVGALEYEFVTGEIVRTHKKVNVYSFKYDYITKFDSNEVLLEDDSKDVVFYSGSEIVVNIDEYSSWMPFKDDADQTYIYKYSEKNRNFNTIFNKNYNKNNIRNDCIYNSELLHTLKSKHLKSKA